MQKFVMSIAVCVVLLLGCTPVGVKPPLPPLGTFAHVASSALELTTGNQPTPDVPVPTPPGPGTHSRSECPNGGWITHGDGHRTRCPDCDPPFASEPPPGDAHADKEGQAKAEPFREPATVSVQETILAQIEPQATCDCAGEGCQCEAAAAQPSVVATPASSMLHMTVRESHGCQGGSTASMGNRQSAWSQSFGSRRRSSGRTVGWRVRRLFGR